MKKFETIYNNSRKLVLLNMAGSLIINQKSLDKNSYKYQFRVFNLYISILKEQSIICDYDMNILGTISLFAENYVSKNLTFKSLCKKIYTYNTTNNKI